MLLQRISRNLRKKTASVIAVVLVFAVLLSTVSMLHLFTIAALETPQMITVSSDESSVSNVVIPIADPDLSGDQFFKLTFEARMITGEKPIVGVLKINKVSTKYNFVTRPQFVENEDEGNNPTDTPTSPDLYCKYDSVKMQYTAVIQMSAATKLPAAVGSSKDMFGAITIGNTEYGTTNGTSIATSDLTREFTFANAELYRLTYTDGKWQETGDNLMPKISAGQINFTNSYSGGYSTTMTPAAIASGGNTLQCIESKKYSTVNNSLVAVDEYNANLSSGHIYTYHELVEPTVGAEGMLPYYTCGCGECDGKRFSKKDQESLIADHSTLVIAKAAEQMIVVKQNENVSNAFIPLNVKAAVQKLANPGVVTGGSSVYTVYAKVKFKARMFSGGMPVLGIVAADGTPLKDAVENEDNENNVVPGMPDLYCVYDPATLAYEAVVRFEVNSTVKGADIALTIGNAEHSGSGADTADYKASFAVSDPRMTILDPSTGAEIGDSENLLPEINSYNTKFTDGELNPIVTSTLSDLIGAPLRDWGINAEGNTVEAASIPETFFAATHHFTEVAKIPSTSTETGTRAYYYCDCGNEDCCFKGKKYFDKGLTEAESDADLVLPKLQMIKIGGGNSNNVFVPLDLSEYVQPKHKVGNSVYVQLTFTARMLEGKKPIVSRVRGSSDKGGDYSWSEPSYADNTNEENGMDPGTGKPRLYTKYDEKTCKFTAVVQLEVGQGYSTLSNGLHDAILIGNAEHNGTGYSAESDSDVSFLFCDPEMYLLNASTGEADTSTGNLLPEISEETLNFGTSYRHNNNPCTLTNHILSAPKNMWSIDGNTNAVSAEAIPDNFFKYYPFVYHKQVDPTKTEKGYRAYYSCECGDPQCIYAGKAYEDKGYTEILPEDLVLSYSQMIKIGSGANNNVFVPLNLKPYVKSEHKDQGGLIYVRLTFTARMLNGTKPIVSRVRGSSDLGGDYSFSEPDYADNNDNVYDGIENKNAAGTVTGPDLYSYYNEDTCKFTAILRLQTGTSYSTLASGVHDAILIGNAEHNGVGYSSETDSTVSFAFCDPELYLMNAKTGEVDTSTGNLMPAICDETLNFEKEYKHNANPCTASNHILSAPKNKWSIDGSKDNIEAKGIPDDYFKPYKFVLHEEVRPTATTTGQRAYYTCECSDPDCMYKGKKYADKGMTEVTDADLFLSESKMITVAGGNNSNVYVPLDLKPYASAKHKTGNAAYVQLTFTARMIDGKKPIVSRVRGSSDKVDSSGNPIQGSWSEPYYTDNSNEVGGTNAQGRPILYTKYDETTCKFTAVIELWVGNSWSTLSNGVHDAILIGHAEHNGLGFQETDSTVAFSFCDPELYLIDLTTGQPDTSTGNLMPAICDENLNFDKVYKHNTDNPCHISNHLLSAPKDMWSIDGNAADVKAESIPDKYFKPYKFVLHPEVRPTTTTTGTRAYYTCECSDPDCMYKGKKFSDKGTTRVADEDLFLGTTKMITVNGYNYSNVYVPLDLKPYAAAKHKNGSAVYVQLTFTARMLGGSKPIISRVRGSSDKKDASGNPIQGTWSEPDYTDNNNETGGLNAKNLPILYTKYDETSCKFTAVIELWVGASYSTLANGVHDAILIGHAEHNGPGYKENDITASFSFCDPELYLIDLTTGKPDTSTGNLMPAICDENLNFDTAYKHTTDNPCKLSNHLLSAPKDRWSIDGNASDAKAEEIPDNYFRPLYGAYTTGKTGEVKTDVSLKPNTKYVLRFGSKYYDEEKTAKPYLALQTGSGTVTAIGKFSNNVGGQYNTVYIFTTPANLSGGVNATVGVNIDAAEVQGVFSNFELYEMEDGKETGKNLISDPTLSGAGAGDADTIWSSTGVIYKPITVYQFKMADPKMLIFSGRNGADTHVGGNGKVEYGKNINAYLENFATVENGKQYIFSVNYKFAGTGYSPEKHDLSDEIGPKILVNKAAGGFTEITEGITESPDEYKLTCIFTADGLSETKNNFKFHFDVIGACTSGYLSSAVLYEYNGKKAVGEQLIKNGDFSTGDTSGWSFSSTGHFYHLIVEDIPENFFTKEGAKPNMIVFRNSTDYYRYDQHIMIKPNTYYQLEWQLQISASKNDESKPTMSFYVDIFNKDESGNYRFRDGINVTSTNIPLPKDYKDDECKDGALQVSGGNYALRFHTTDEVRTTGDGNTYVRLYTMAESAGYWGSIALYELDEKGNKIGNNIVLNGDFTCGLSCWMPAGDTTDRIVQQPDHFFDSAETPTPKEMVYSDGSSSDQTYGNTFTVNPNTKYYFSGTYVNMNAQGLTPEILYKKADGKYQKIDTQLFYDPNRYFFEIGFEIPEDALLTDGQASIKVQLNNYEKGKGYFTELSLTEEGYYENYFDAKGFAGGKNYQKIAYNPAVFVFYYDDTAFDDGNWSGEASLIADSSASGIVTDEYGNPIEGVQVRLSPGYTTTTDKDGKYSFNKVAPGEYTLYVIDPFTNEQISCLTITVEQAKAVLFPPITCSESDIGADGDAEIFDKAMIDATVVDKKGNPLSFIPVYIEDNGYAFTDSDGFVSFDSLTELGSKEVYIYLTDGTKYVFRTVNLEAGKGARIKLVYRGNTGVDDELEEGAKKGKKKIIRRIIKRKKQTDDEGLSPLVIVVICVGAGVLLLAGGFVLFLLLKKRKKDKKTE